MQSDTRNASRLVALHRRVASAERGAILVVLRTLLVLPAVLYGLVARVRNALYDAGVLRAHRVPNAVVISVGNLTAGGTGKTPVVMELARAALAAGRKPAILTRGYRRGDSVESDEAKLLARALPDVPLVVGADRRKTAAAAVAHGANVLLLDDGFQHRRLARDIDLVLLDARDPFGGDWQLPRGFLREPGSGLARASAVLITRAQRASPAALMALRSIVTTKAKRVVPIVAENHRPVALVDLAASTSAPLDRVRGRRVLAFSGIGDPEALRETLEALGASVVSSLAFPDHHAFAATDLDSIRRAARDVECVVTTEKDAMRLGGFALDRPLYALRIAAEFEIGPDLDALSQLLGFPLSAAS